MKQKILQYLEQMQAQTDKDSAALIGYLKEHIEHMAEPKAERVKTEKPCMKNSLITIPIWECGWCHTQVTGRDIYCPGCGRRLTDEKAVCR